MLLLPAQALVTPTLLQGKLGRILNRGPGSTTGTLVTADLKQLGISPGWHQLVVQGKATDPTTKLTQTGEGVMLQAAVRHGGRWGRVAHSLCQLRSDPAAVSGWQRMLRRQRGWQNPSSHAPCWPGRRPNAHSDGTPAPPRFALFNSPCSQCRLLL